MKKTLFLLFFVAISTATRAAIYYVTVNGGGNGNGYSWANARSASLLQNTINAAVAGDEIWVAAGVYRPTQNTMNNTVPTDVREKCFVLKNGVKILGGFPSIGTPTLADRKPFFYKTIWSGELQNDNNINNNAYNVIKNYRNGVTISTILDGFWITGGNGGTTTDGSGMLLDQTSPNIYNCVFTENVSNKGGALSIANNSSAKFTTCIVMNNTANDKGGAAATNASSPIFANSLIFNNKAANGGAAFYATTTSTLTFYVCDIHGNFSTQSGAFAYTEGSNNRFNIYNSIVWSNTGLGFIYDDWAVSTRSVQNSVYPLLTPASFYNVNENPLYTAEWDPDGDDDVFGTEDDGLMLSGDSPAIGLGNINLIPANITTDITGSPRLSGTKIDAGAYEYRSTTTVATEAAPQSNGFLAFPNPVHDLLYIRCEKAAQNTVFNLFSATGSLVYNTAWRNTAADEISTINMPELPQGVYFYQIVADERLYIQKMIIE